MSEEKKICPFMSRIVHTGFTWFVDCKEEKCMAWGVIAFIRITDDRESVEWGCKLMQRGVE